MPVPIKLIQEKRRPFGRLFLIIYSGEIWLWAWSVTGAYAALRQNMNCHNLFCFWPVCLQGRPKYSINLGQYSQKRPWRKYLYQAQINISVSIEAGGWSVEVEAKFSLQRPALQKTHWPLCLHRRCPAQHTSAKLRNKKWLCKNFRY